MKERCDVHVSGSEAGMAVLSGAVLGSGLVFFSPPAIAAGVGVGVVGGVKYLTRKRMEILKEKRRARKEASENSEMAKLIASKKRLREFFILEEGR